MTEQAEVLAAQHDSLARVIRVAARIVGVVFLVAGLAWLAQEIRFGWAAQSASGTIVEVRARESAEGPEFYSAVEFVALDGRVIRCPRSSECAGQNCRWIGRPLTTEAGCYEDS